MRLIRKYYLALPSGAGLVIEARAKREAVDHLEQMGHQVGCKDLELVKEDVFDMDVEDIKISW